jgi:hypothetical protein
MYEDRRPVIRRAFDELEHCAVELPRAEKAALRLRRQTTPMPWQTHWQLHRLVRLRGLNVADALTDDSSEPVRGKC